MAAFGIGAALSHLSNLGQFVQLGQGHAYMKEQMEWTKRSYRLDLQALRLDLLSSAKDEIRAHYDTYVAKIDTLVLVTALLWPFALNSLQFTDELLPPEETGCKYASEGQTCVQAQFPFLLAIWTWLVGLILVLPFNAMLLFMSCRSKLSDWLAVALEDLNLERRETVLSVRTPGAVAEASPSKGHDGPLLTMQSACLESQEVVSRLGTLIITYQDLFAKVWLQDCGFQFRLGKLLLWTCAVLSIFLITLMFWMYLANRKGKQHPAAYFFLSVVLIGVILPAIYFPILKFRRKDVLTQAEAQSEELNTFSAAIDGGSVVGALPEFGAASSIRQGRRSRASRSLSRSRSPRRGQSDQETPTSSSSSLPGLADDPSRG